MLTDAEINRAKAILDKLMIEGLESGEPIPVTAEYWREKQRALDEYVSQKRQGGA